MFSLTGYSAANVGQVQGAASKGVIKNLCVGGFEFTAADNADPASREAALAAYSLKAKTDPSKLFLFPEVQNVEDKSESDKEGTLNLGFKMVLVEGKPAYEIRMFADSEAAINYRKFNGKTVPVWEIDDTRKMWGAKKGTSVVGYDAKIQFKGQKVATGQNVESGVVVATVSFLNSSQYFDNPKYIDLAEVDMSAIATQVDADLVYKSAAVNVFKIGVEIPTAEANGVINVYERFADELADASLWVAKTGTNYATALAITSVAKDDALGCYTVTFDSTAFAALADGAKIKLSLVDPAALVAADVLDMEGVPCVITKAA